MKWSRTIILALGLLLSACGPDANHTSAALHEGQQLAQRYCQSCHLLPEAGILDQSTWKYEILPNMAERMGINTGRMHQIERLEQLGLFPEEAVLTQSEYDKIREYYLHLAPLLNNPVGSLMQITSKLPQFELVDPQLTEISPFTTMIQFDTSRRILYLGNSVTRSLYSYSELSGLKGPVSLSGPPSGLIRSGSKLYALTMGKIMPHDDKRGTLSSVEEDPVEQPAEGQVVIEELERPVHATVADLDLNGQDDLIISCFGNNSGALIWYKDFETEGREKKVLRPLPGAVKAEVVDYNRDGLPDIIALMAQGDEGFFLYKNEGKGKFAERKLMGFPPTYGSTYFELIDFDQDGDQDILYVNGDNGDYLPIIKDFHGIRLFLNDGAYHFKEKFFLRHHGAFKAKALDFDEDGDMDIAAISYFPDYRNRPQEGFIYYENLGNDRFKAFSFAESTAGKWLTLDTGDIDQDGDQDIVIGSSFFMTFEVPFEIKQSWQQHAPAFLILKNRLR